MLYDLPHPIKPVIIVSTLCNAIRMEVERLEQQAAVDGDFICSPVVMGKIKSLLMLAIAAKDWNYLRLRLIELHETTLAAVRDHPNPGAVLIYGMVRAAALGVMATLDEQATEHNSRWN